MVSFFNDLFDLAENVEGTPWDFAIPGIVGIALIYSFIHWIVVPAWKGVLRLIAWRKKKRFSVHESLRYMQSADVYYAIDHYIPTRYSAKDPARNEEPVPEYMGEEGRREPLLLDHFLKYEFDQRHGGKFYLVLGDCGMGKTTFLINLFYAASRKRKHPCAFVSLVNSDCLEQIKKIPDQEKTILLLDALDESDAAMRDLGKFMVDLESEVRDFYRVVITSRTNFFTNAEKERLFQGKSSASTTEKISGARKYYIAPFTDEDIQHYLHQRYHRRKKYRQAWDLVEANKNLSVRPLMLRYMDDMIREDIHFSHDFELYEYLFRRWIAREADKTTAAQQELYDECLTLTKAMYYQWMKDGRVGIYPTEIDEAKAIPGLSRIRFQGHAILNRTAEGMYKFAHRSYWEYLVALLALKDLPFSDDLFIRNFEQAEVFLKEMITFADTGESESASFREPAVRLGTANYYIKYWRPEEAERILLEVLDGDVELTEEQELFARIHLIRAYRYQWKEASAEKMLLPLHERLEKTELTVELVPQFTQFGVELAEYSRTRKLRIGQVFLKGIIEFCKAHPMPGYNLFVCYERYCRCSVNYAAKETMLSEMLQLAKERGFLQDKSQNEYVTYLCMLASIWKMPYSDKDTLSFEKIVIGSYDRFFDNYTAINRKGSLACSIIAFFESTLEIEFDEVNENGPEFLGQAYDVCCAIYDEVDSDYETLRKPYVAQVIEWSAMYVDHPPIFEGSALEKQNSLLLEYRCRAHLEDEMQIRYCAILRRSGRYQSADFLQKETYLMERLNWARAIQCRDEEIDALWDIYVLYDNAEEVLSDGQEYLKMAYDIACTDFDYRETPDYCELLRVMIDFYKGESDKNALYRELRDITPGIYGNDVRRATIYRCLREYAANVGDAQTLEFALECLRCEFDQLELKATYDACVKFADESRFLTELETSLRGMSQITVEVEKSVELFLQNKLITEIADELDTLSTNSDNTDNSVAKILDSDRYEPEISSFETDAHTSVYSPEFTKKVWETVRRVKQEKERIRMAWGRAKESSALR